MVCAIGSMAQTTIKMKTAKEIGEDFALTVNEGLICIIDWGDGKTDTVYSYFWHRSWKQHHTVGYRDNLFRLL